MCSSEALALQNPAISLQKGVISFADVCYNAGDFDSFAC